MSTPDASPPELPRHWYSMTRLALGCFAVGSTLVACSLIAWWLILLPTGELVRPLVALFYDRWSLAFGLLTMSFGIAAWTRAWITLRRVSPLLALLIGIGCVTVTGYREVHAPATALPQVTHAVIGIGAVALILIGVATSSRAFAPLVGLFGILPEATRIARLLRWFVYATLLAGLVVPFVPMLFGDATPRAWTHRIAATGALILAIPLVVTALSAWRMLRVLRGAERRVPICLRCGYPRPAGETCPECGDRR